MAQLIQLIELMLHGETFRIELGGCVALAEGDKPVAVIKLGSLADAEQLERAAARLPVTFRWKTGHDVSRTVSVAEFEKLCTPRATSYRNTQPGKTDKCVRCGDKVPPEMHNLCMRCEYTPSFDYGSSE